MRPAKISWLFCAIALLCLGCIFLARRSHDQIVATPVVAGADALGGAFQLVDQNGQPRTDKSWPGQYLLLYFGFTRCPDVCPTGLNKIAEAYRMLDASQQQALQPIFVTVDPARDTSAAIKDYLPLFHPNFVGLTGTDAQIDAIKKAFKVYAEKQGGGDNYMVNHSAYTYLLDPQGHLVGLYAHETTSDAMAHQIAQAMTVKKN